MYDWIVVPLVLSTFLLLADIGMFVLQKREPSRDAARNRISHCPVTICLKAILFGIRRVFSVDHSALRLSLASGSAYLDQP
jgi:hypothetical protein